MNILSGCTQIRFNSIINHASYAKIFDYKYKFDSEKRNLSSVFDHKILSILELPIDNEWWFWIDDDAFFTDYKPFNSLNLEFDTNIMIFPKSPVNPNGGWTFLTSGSFFFKNNQEVKNFFQKVLVRNIEEVKNWWDFNKYGIFTNGDQDRIVYELVKDEDLMSKIALVNYEIFNTRPYHFKKINDHFLVHFAGNNKAKAIQKFKLDFSFNDTSLVPIKYEKIANKIKESLSK
tara:strand:+ start:154 stop:849 length:696 start_codon:yes stop_codon:yes gene_type:complete